MQLVLLASDALLLLLLFNPRSIQSDQSVVVVELLMIGDVVVVQPLDVDEKIRVVVVVVALRKDRTVPVVVGLTTLKRLLLDVLLVSCSS